MIDRPTKPHIQSRDCDGQPIGKNPMDMGREELEAAGFSRMSPAKAIRANCMDCMGGAENGAAKLVRECAASQCPLWPFRMGKNPWSAQTERTLTETHLQAMVKGRQKLRQTIQ